MYNAFEQRPADIYSILARLDSEYSYRVDRAGHDIARSIAIEMNLPWQDHGNSIEAGVLGHRRDYGSSVERLDGARCRIKTWGNNLEINYELTYYTPEGDQEHTTGRLTLDPARGWEQIVTTVVTWVTLFDIDAEKDRITQEIITAVDSAPNAEQAFRATSLNGLVYADMARDLYLAHHGVDTTPKRKPREQRELFLATWEKNHAN